MNAAPVRSTSPNPSWPWFAAAALVLLVGACASEKEMLIPIRSPAPAEVDFSGRWRMQDNFADMQRRIDLAIRQTDGIDEKQVMRNMVSRQRRGGRPGRGDVGGLVHVFLENAANLKITQTGDGMFIGFDRSIVEEYRFGEARTVRVGGAVAQRVSGWDGEDYVIETLDEDGMKLTERYALTDSARRLTREIVLRGKNLERVTIVQTYGKDRG